MAAGNAKINVIVDGLKQVQALERSLNNISRLSGKINQGTSGAVPVRIEKTTAQLKEAQRASMVKTRNIGDQIEKLAAQGLNVDRARAAIKRASIADSQKLLTLAKSQQEAALETLKTEKFTTKEKNRQRQFGSIRGMGGGRFGGGINPRGNSAALTSGAISGAFPLLFGQGIPGAAAGFAGGFIGTKAGGQMGGFAGGLVATAALQSIQQAVTAVGDLGKAMSPLTQNTQALSNALGLVGTPAGKYLETLEQTQGKQVAFNEAMRRMENLVGVNGVKALQDFGEGTRKLQQDITTFLTRIAAKAAELLNNIGGGGGGGTGRPVGLARANLLAQGRNTTTGPLADEIQEVVAKLETANRKTRAGLQDELIELVKKRNLLQENLDITNDANAKFEKTLENFTQENEHLQNVLQLGKEGAQIEQEKLRVAKELNIEVGKLSPKQVEQIANSVKLNNQLKEQRQIQEQIQNILAGGMTNAVMGLIEGTKTLGQVLADVAKQLASIFLNRAFMSIFGNMFGGGGGGGLDTNALVARDNAFYGNTFPRGSFASGGYVSSPTMGLVGEAGESEYVIPASKMSGAMARYSAGARGGSVIPGGSGDSGTVAGSTGNTIVEYTGPTLNFNGDEYVPKSAVPEIIGAAAKQGAMAGKAQVLGTLRNSRGQRASLGL